MTEPTTPQLRTGLTTGTCAAAATKAAALALKGLRPEAVEVTLPDGSVVSVEVLMTRLLAEGSEAQAAIRKDAGDDPDATNGMVVMATVKREAGDAIRFEAGEGVGVVTKPGLQLPPGEAAINPTPRRMMAAAFAEVFPGEGATITVSVPGGAEKAQNTFNPKLGIVGGISILGTSGRVIPRSEEAWFRSLLPQIDMAVAQGFTTLIVTPGSFGAALRAHLPRVPDDAVVHAGNFVGDVLTECRKRGVKEVILAGHAGKLVKIAAGIFNTHSRFGDARLETVAALAAAAGASPLLAARLLAANTTEDAATLLAGEHLERVWNDVAERASWRASAHAKMAVHCALANYQGELLGLSSGLRHEPRKAKTALCVVGVGPGTPAWLSPLAWRAIHEAQVLVGGERHLQELAGRHQERVALSARLEELPATLRPHAGKAITFLASGDPGLFGLLAFVRRAWPEAELRVVPGISSFQLAAARLQIPWENVRLTSAHGRPLADLRGEILSHERLFVLTDRHQTAARVAQSLVEWGIDCRMAVLENLSYDHETLTRGTPGELAERVFDPLAVVFIDRTE